MKKIIALMMALLLCLGLFAGCQKEAPDTDPSDSTPTETTVDHAANLVSAKDYLYNLYKGTAAKGEPNRAATDFEVISVVVIAGINYNVEWTAKVTTGNAEDVTVTDGNNGNKKIDLNEKPEVETEFTLTATVKDEEGNTQSVDFLYFIPAGPTVNTAEEIVLYYPNGNQYVTDTVYEYTTKNELVLSEKKSDAVIFTIVQKDDGKVSFKTKDGKWLFCDGTNVQFADAEGEYTLFTMETAEGGFYVKSQGLYNNDPAKPQYLEVYKGYLTCYGLSDSSDVKIYTFATQDAEGAGTTTPDAGDSTEATTPPTTGGNNGSGSTSGNGTYATAPEVGKTYKLGLYQEQKGAVYYFVGTMSGYYGATETDASLAVAVTVEDAGSGKYYLSFTVNGAKKYIGTEVSGTHLNFKIMDEAGRATFSWNSEYSTFTTVMSNGKEAFMGTYSNYVTFGMSAIDKIATSYPAHLYN